jgi:UDP-glucose 4-epimerase
MKLVTGCAGFIGSHLAESLMKKGWKVFGVDNFDPYYDSKIKKKNIDALRKFEGFEFIEGDIFEDSVLKTIFEREIDVVYHLAASAGVRNSIKYPTLYCKNDVFSTAKLLEYSKDNNVKKFVFASSSSVYGEVSEQELPVKESREPKPISPYALSKLNGEMWCQLYNEIYDLDTVILRYFTVYGPRQRPDEAFTKFITKIINGEQIEIYGNGEQTRDFTYVQDIVDGTILAAEKGNGIYNLGGGNRISVNEMVSVIGEVMRIQINKINIEKQQGDVSHTGADISKARTELGYEPKVSLREGTKSHVSWAKSN